MNEEFIIECVCGFLVILFIAGLSAMKSWLDFKNFKMKHLKSVHPEKYEELKYSAVSDERLNDNIGERGSEEE